MILNLFYQENDINLLNWNQSHSMG